jgi:hypothetical protein
VIVGTRKEKENVMKRFILAALSTLAALGFSGSSAWAQNTYPYMPPQYGPGYQTQLSPYLNFLRGGDPAANYFLGVIPEFQRRQNTNQFRSQIQDLQVRTAPIRTPEEMIEARTNPKKLLPSGHAAAFNSTLGYFNNLGGSIPRPQGGAGPQGGGAGRPATPGAPSPFGR